MNGSAEFEVAAEAYSQVIKVSLFTAYREKIGKSLCRVIVTSVTCVYYGNRRIERSDIGCALLGVTHSNYIGVTGNDLNRIGYAFALDG